MAGILQIIEGAAAIAAGIVIDVYTGGTMGNWLIAAGAGILIGGIGAAIAGDPLKGFATTTRNSIAPWRVSYGQVRTGGTMVYMHTWGNEDQMLDMVIVLACHPCQSFDELLFDQQRVQIDTAGIPTTARAGYSITPPAAGSGTSFTPVQQTVSISTIARDVNGVVTVTLPSNIPYLTSGDQILIQNVSSDLTFNGTFQVSEIINRTSGIVFTYLSGGTVHSISGQGQVKTKWPDYGRNIYVEPMLGTQTLGQTFVGMLAGTPWQGNGKLCTPASPQNAGGTAAPNPWTQYCSLVGKTAIFVRIQYDQGKFPSGIPQISFLLKGKNDISDFRTSPATVGYTENSALCIADYLANLTYGFKASYGSDIPVADLNAAANICDQAVTLAIGGTEPRYTCNGQFELTARRGETLQNLLTSCAGRIAYQGGQFKIYPGSWLGASPVSVDLIAIAAGSFKWRPKSTIRDLYNAVKGTYISPDNKWQSTDFPRYARDVLHGYGSAIDLIADGGERRVMEMHLPFTISAATAQRIAKIMLLRSRYSGTGTFSLNMAGYKLAPLDILSATCSPLGWSGKIIEVGATRFKADEHDGAVVLGTEIDVQEADSAIYAWATTEELSPQGYGQSKYPTGIFLGSAPWPWSPGYTVPLPGDAFYPKGATGQASFGIQPVYDFDASGVPAVSIQIKGTAPINALDFDIAAPGISGSGLSTGGSLPTGDYVVAVAAFDSGASTHANSDYQALLTLHVPGSGAGSISLDIVWGSGDDGGDVYLAQWNSTEFFVFHYVATLAPGAATYTITTFDESTHGGVDNDFSHFAISWMEETHSGCWAEQVQALPDAITITISGAGMTTNQWAGRTLSLLAKNDLTMEIPVLNIPIVSSSASSSSPPAFDLVLGANSGGVTLADIRTLLEVGDLVTMRNLPIFTDSSFSDTEIANPFYPDGATGVEAGHVAIALTGANAGDMRTIESVSVDGGGNYTVFNLAGKWAITPATGDVVIVCAPSNEPEWKSAGLWNRNAALAAVMAQPKVVNLARKTWFVRVRAEDENGLACPDSLAPFREIYQQGSVGSPLTPSDGYFDNTPVSGHVLIDLSNGLSQAILVSEDLIIDAPTGPSSLLSQGQYLRLKFTMDTPGGFALDFTTAGVWIDFTGQDPDPTEGYSSNYEAYLRPDGNWEYAGGARGTHT